MGPWLVLVSPCFRKNVVASCKIGSFLCSLDYLLQKNAIVFFFWKSNFRMALIKKKKKKGYFWPTFHSFLVTREKLQKFLQHISHSHSYTYFPHPIDIFALQIYRVWFLFGMIPGVDSYTRHFGTTNKQQNDEQNLSWNVYY